MTWHITYLDRVVLFENGVYIYNLYDMSFYKKNNI